MIKRLVFALILLAIVIISGTAGHVLIERWGMLDSLHMTIISYISG